MIKTLALIELGNTFVSGFDKLSWWLVPDFPPQSMVFCLEDESRWTTEWAKVQRFQEHTHRLSLRHRVVSLPTTRRSLPNPGARHPSYLGKLRRAGWKRRLQNPEEMASSRVS